MKKLTKIVATIGPVTSSEEQIEKLIDSGVNVIRFNFKHGDVDWHGEVMERVAKVCDKKHSRVATLIDLQGPEIRIYMPHDQIEIEEGEEILLSEKVFDDESIKGICLSHVEVIDHLKDGQFVSADDGAFEFEVVKKGGDVYLKCKTTGVLKNKKSLNVPGGDFPLPLLVERDLDGIKLAALKEVDFVALSFVRSGRDIEVIRKEMKKHKVNARVIAKIETQKAIDDLDAIIEASDGIMVARGDLGVELPMERVPYYQKLIIRKSIEANKPVITATQMLETMTDNPFPTRAEVSDVGNAAFDFTDAVMLSGETAGGKYPIKAVQVMARTVAYNETKFEEDTRLRFDFPIKDTETLVCNSAYDLYIAFKKKRMRIDGFVVFTESGRTARMMSMFRPYAPIFAFCPDTQTADSLELNFAVKPVVMSSRHKDHAAVTWIHVGSSIKYLLKEKMIEPDGRYIVLYGDRWAETYGTSTVKVVEVADLVK